LPKKQKTCILVYAITNPITEEKSMNKLQAVIATEDLGWSLEKAESIFTWADFNGYWADWSEWDADEFVKFFSMVEREYHAACPHNRFRALESDEKAKSRALHPTAFGKPS
jgi:hypothetical protein